MSSLWEIDGTLLAVSGVLCYAAECPCGSVPASCPCTEDPPSWPCGGLNETYSVTFDAYVRSWAGSGCDGTPGCSHLILSASETVTWNGNCVCRNCEWSFLGPIGTSGCGGLWAQLDLYLDTELRQWRLSAVCDLIGPGVGLSPQVNLSSGDTPAGAYGSGSSLCYYDAGLDTSWQVQILNVVVS